MKYMPLFPQSPSVVHVVISILCLPHVPCMRDTFPCVCKYVVLSNTDLNILRSLSARIIMAGWDS